MNTSFCVIRCFSKSEDESYKLSASSWEIHPMDKLDLWLRDRYAGILKEDKDIFILKDIPFRTDDPDELDLPGIWLTRSNFAQNRQNLYEEAEAEYNEKLKTFGTESDGIDNNEAFLEYFDRIKEIDDQIDQEFTEFLNKFEKLEFNEHI